MERKSFSQLVGMRAGDDDRDDKVGDADQREQERRAEAELLQHREDDRADHHEGGVEHVDGRDDAGAVVGAGPGLHRGEGRHDEQAARDREAGEVDGDVNAVRRREIAGNVEWAGRHDQL